MGDLPGIADLADVAAIEETPYSQRVTQPSTYHQIAEAALAGPDQPAISFIADGNDFADPLQITYGQLLGRINQAANLFHELGVGPQDVVSFLLPNLPQTFWFSAATFLKSKPRAYITPAAPRGAPSWPGAAT
jgi:fatty-acyl-CoA synthase